MLIFSRLHIIVERMQQNDHHKLAVSDFSKALSIQFAERHSIQASDAF